MSTVTWTATGDGLSPSEFDESAIFGGPMPDADQIAFTAEHPAPTLTLAASAGDGHGAAADDTKAASITTGVTTDEDAGSAST